MALTYNDKDWQVRRKVEEKKSFGVNGETYIKIRYLIITAGSSIEVCSIAYYPVDNTTLHIIDDSYSLLFDFYAFKQRRAIYQALHLFTEDIEKLIEKYNITKESGIRVY